MKRLDAYLLAAVVGLAVPNAPSRPVHPSADTTDIAQLPQVAPKQAGDRQCADIGAPSQPGSPVDTLTDLLKNRVDDGHYADVSVTKVLELPWENLPVRRYKWTAAQTKGVARYERAAVTLTGYLISVKQEGNEATNCELPSAAWHDWHLWLVRTEAEAHAGDKTHAVVIEITPRVRALGQQTWDIHQIAAWARTGQKMTVSGWLLLDPDHPDQVGKSRGTIWEVHPVMHIGSAQ